MGNLIDSMTRSERDHALETPSLRRFIEKQDRRHAKPYSQSSTLHNINNEPNPECGQVGVINKGDESHVWEYENKSKSVHVNGLVLESLQYDRPNHKLTNNIFKTVKLMFPKVAFTHSTMNYEGGRQLVMMWPCQNGICYELWSQRMFGCSYVRVRRRFSGHDGFTFDFIADDAATAIGKMFEKQMFI